MIIAQEKEIWLFVYVILMDSVRGHFTLSEYNIMK